MLVLAALCGLVFAGLAPGRAAATFPLHVEILWSGDDAACPPGLYAPTVQCHPHPGGPIAVPGLGFVTQEYLYPVETAPGPACADGLYVMGYTARLRVEGKGEIHLSLGPVNGCLHGPPEDSVLTPTQPFTITGGTGVYASASGSGILTRANPTRTPAGHGSATDIWSGTLVVPGLEFDLTPPMISGAVHKVVKAPRYRVVRVSRGKTKRVPVKDLRVKYEVAAVDNVDGPVPVVCKPKSGSRFRVGRSTVVHCSATDKSANTAMAQFAVTVRRA